MHYRRLLAASLLACVPQWALAQRSAAASATETAKPQDPAVTWSAPAAVDGGEAMGELRTTIVNLLQGMVERGALTMDQAERMVKEAQQTAVAATEVKAETERQTVRVPYVPQVVKEEIRKQVAQDLAPQVSKEVIATAKAEGWGVPAALPDWVQRMRWSGDVRMRGQLDQFGEDNLPNTYLNFQAINERGGIGRAGAQAFSNVTEERQRMRARVRLAVEAMLDAGWVVGVRLASGNLRDAASTNQTLGNLNGRYTVGLDQAYIGWRGNFDGGSHRIHVDAGRLPSPWLSTDLVFDSDLVFDGVAARYAYHFGEHLPAASLTLGGFPLQENELGADKWLLGAQLGMDWSFSDGSRLRLGGAVYDFRNVAGRRNELDSDLYDYTAPLFLNRGNTLFDIRNDADVNTNLFALAADYRLANATAVFDWRVSPSHNFSVTADYVRNIGYDEDALYRRTGYSVERRDTGYQTEMALGSRDMEPQGAWRTFLGYRYLERDAALDAFTDSDFRLGGTDVQGFYIGGDYSLFRRVRAGVRYLSGNEIDGPPLGVDVLLLDLNASF